MQKTASNKNYVTTITAAIAMLCSTSTLANSSFLIEEENLPPKFIVKFKQEGPSSMSNALFSGERIVQESVLEQVSAKNVEKIGSEPVYSVELSDENLNRLQNRSEVDYVEPDPIRYLLSESIPWGLTSVGLDQLDDSNAGNRTVCIIDSGYDIAHNDLSGNRVSGTNDSITFEWSVPGKDNAHGTHVAGTIAAIANNEGVKGVMPNQRVNLHIIKVFNSSGWGYSSSLVKAVQTCADNGADVVNMSLGGSASSRVESSAMQKLYDDGVLLIAAAGNDGNLAHSYPASYDSVMSVAAIDNQNHYAAFSQATNQVEIAAPGMAILSTVTRGEGILSDIVIDGNSNFERGIVPHNRLIKVSGKYQGAHISGSVTAPLKLCNTSSGRYDCGSMTNNICFVERIENQRPGYRPEIDAVKACYQAGAEAAIVYSNSTLIGLQNPFVLDDYDRYPLLSVTVDRQFGQQLNNLTGQDITVTTTKNEDYQYYNGTSMATPHVTGVAGLVWSYHPECSASQVRAALTQSATDIGAVGRDNQTGYGRINATAAKEYLDQGCNGPKNSAVELENGVEKTALSGDSKSSTLYTFDVPAEATSASFTLSGGSGDVNLYVSFNGTPSITSADCKSTKSSNNETCTLTVPSAGQFQVLLYGYDAYSGVALKATHNGAGLNASKYSNDKSVSIPDNSSTGAISEIEVKHQGAAGTVSVAVDITHSYIADLLVTLTSPAGKQITLHSNEGGSSNDINKTYEADFAQTELQGVWRLKVVDSASQDVGKINSWSLTFN